MSVDPGKTDGVAAVKFDQVDQAFVDLACQDHLGDIDRFPVRHPQPVDELRFFPEPLHQLADFGTSPVDQYDADPDECQQHDIFHDLLLEFLVDHGVAAVFDHNNFPVITPDVRDSLNQNLCPFGI